MIKIATIKAGSIVWIDGVSYVLSQGMHILVEADRLQPQPKPKT